MVASVLFGAMAVLAGVAVTAILKRLAAPADEPPYYGTTPRARRLIGSVISLVLLAFVWSWLWGGFYTVTMAGNSVELTYRGPTRRYSLSPAGLQVTWVPAGKMQQALQLTTADGTTYTSKPTSLSRDNRAALESLLAGRR